MQTLRAVDFFLNQDLSAALKLKQRYIRGSRVCTNYVTKIATLLQNYKFSILLAKRLTYHLTLEVIIHD